jgi:hypothetical protein
MHLRSGGALFLHTGDHGRLVQVLRSNRFMARPKPDRLKQADQDERDEREARVTEIMTRARHHQNQAEKLQTDVRRLRSQGEPRTRRSVPKR